MAQNAQIANAGKGTPIKVWVPGKVKPWPRPVPLMKRFRGLARCSENRGCRVKIVPGASDKEWRKTVIARVGFLVGQCAPWFQSGDSLVLAARMYHRRPKTHYVANDRARPLKESAPAPGEYAQKPDLDNCVKAVCDALQESRLFPDGLLYADDKQVDYLLTRKLWAGPTKEPGMDLIVCRAEDASGDIWGWLSR